jgi:hypothetical protein
MRIWRLARTDAIQSKSSPMPYFQRKPVERIEEIPRSGVPILGLTPRGAATGSGISAGAPPISREADASSIVPLADAILASERPLGEHGNKPKRPLPSVTGMGLDAECAISPSTRTPVLESPRNAAGLIVEPAPVVSPAGPVAPGATAEAIVSLVNEDEQPAQIEFFGTGLVGQDGALIQADSLVFQPPKLTLEVGESGDVVVQVVVPAHTRGGVYSGLIRASKLDYLHAVLVVQVNEP